MEARDKASDVVADAGIGAAIGGVGGLLLSAAGALTIPVIGPILAAGPIAAALTGAGIGAAAGGLIGALTESGVPEEDAKYYAEGVRRGDVLVTAKVDATQADRVCDIFDDHDAIDVDARVQDWKTRGWEGWNAKAQPYTSDEFRQERTYYRAGETGGIGREALPSSSGVRTTGGSSSGYAGQPSSHVSGSNLSTDPRDRDKDGWVVDDKMRDAGQSIKQTVEGAGRKTRDAVKNLKDDVRDNTPTADRDRGYGEFADAATDLNIKRDPQVRDPRDKDGDGWVVDDKMRELGREVKEAVRGAGNEVKTESRNIRDDTRRMDDAERRRRARIYDRTLL